MKFPRENLYRASLPGLEMRSTESGASLMTGHFAVFNQWTEINSSWEGRFMERIAPGAFTKTFAERGERIKVLFQHGRDPQIGVKPLGTVQALREDEQGAYYEVELFDTSYNRDLIPGLKAEPPAYGASFRFNAVRENFREANEVEPSAYNPQGLPERTIQEASVPEFGPVTFGAYAGATAGVRSITDLIHDVDAVTLATPILLDDERLGHARAFITRSLPEAPVEERAEDTEDSDAPDEPSAADPPEDQHPDSPRRVAPLYGLQVAEPTWRL